MESSLQAPLAPSSLKELLRAGDAGFWDLLRSETERTSEFGELMLLSNLRRRALRAGPECPYKSTTRIAIIGGASLHPLADLAEHFTSVLGGTGVEIWSGDFDNYVSEISSDESELFAFAPDIVFFLPSERRCVFTGPLTSPVSDQKFQADRVVDDILDLCGRIHQRSGAPVILGNFRLPPYFDPGPMRYTTLASNYGFRKYVNLELGLKLPNFVTICDIEFLSNRLGTLASADQRTWFESKQPFSAALMISVAREFALTASSLKKAAKKVIVLDLDNTLWGGVVGDDGLEGIEIGTTSPVGEAYRDFQLNLLALSKRGILLAVCSKNDHDKAIEPFERHPEMILRLSDIVNFKANWEPKSENIRKIAHELNLGLDSLVFLDDNPAEIEIIRQFVPEVSVVWLGDDPSTYSQQLLDSRFFEQRSVTSEDQERTQLYRQEAKRQELQRDVTDMNAYLRSLEMTAHISEFTAVDVPRIAQLINKSNQFNLTTKRRTEAEVKALLSALGYVTFTIRLADKFGDHGLIAIVIGQVKDGDLHLDTWLMSCRVLKRQVEEETVNAIVRLARSEGCGRVVGTYIPSAKNSMVKDLYPNLGFTEESVDESRSVFALDVGSYATKPTHISVQ